MDSQSVKTTEESGGIKEGYDGANRSKAERHILVDTLGLLLSVYVRRPIPPTRWERAAY